jgi:N-acetylmuramoyl-L-alanine amidase
VRRFTVTQLGDDHFFISFLRTGTFKPGDRENAMAHIEDTNCKLAAALVKQGSSVTLFACGISTSADSPYKIAVFRKNEETGFIALSVHASKGKPHPVYKSSKLDPDLTPYLFSISPVQTGDEIVITYNDQRFSMPAKVVERQLTNNEALLLHSAEGLRNMNVLYPEGSVAPVRANLYAMSPTPRGLAIHVTAGEGKAQQFVNGWGSSGIGAHFIIDRDGFITQCVALTLRGEAQGGPDGDPNRHWLSVEFVVKMNNAGTDGYFRGVQLLAGRRLFIDLQKKFGFNNGLAAPFLGDQKQFADASAAMAAPLGVTGVKTRAEAVLSSGLSCHRWLGPGHACPGLVGINIMPSLLGKGPLNDLEF